MDEVRSGLESPSDSSGSGIQLSRLVRSLEKDDAADGCSQRKAPTSSCAAEIANEELRILPPEVKMEVTRSPQLEKNDVLDDPVATSEDSTSGQQLVSSTNLDVNNNDLKATDVIHLEQENEDLPDASLQTVSENPVSDLPQDLSVSSSRKEFSFLQNSKAVVPEEDVEEESCKVSSTTTTLAPKITSPSSASWGLSKKISPVLKTREKRRFACKHCDFVTANYSTVYAHFKRLHPRVFKQGQLYRHYNKSFGLPVKKKVPMLYACQHCNYVTLSMRGFSNHSKRVHPRRRANPLKQGSSVTSSTNKKYLEALYKSGDGPNKFREKIRRLLIAYHCDSRVLVKESLMNASTSRRDSPKNDIDFICILCHQEFRTKFQLNQHYRFSHPEQGPKKNPTTGLFHCKLCPHDTLSRSALRVHYSRLHFMDAFYTWNVPSLEDYFQEKDRYGKNRLKSSTRSSKVTNHNKNKLLEGLDVFMKSTVKWNLDETTKSQEADTRIPCILCDFSNKNIVGLLSHYQAEHNGRYPLGFRTLLLKRLMLHTETVKLPESDLHLINGAQGAWLSEDGRIMQLYKYCCLLCGHKSSNFKAMADHFAEMHPDVRQYSNCIEALQNVSDDELSAMDTILQCRECGYIGKQVENMEEHHGQQHSRIPFDSNNLIKAIPGATKLYVCQWCVFKADEDTMHWHYTQCHDSQPFSVSDLSLDASSKHNLFSCFACDFYSDSDVDLAFHYQRYHFSHVMTFTTPLHEDGYQCLMCTAIMPSLAGMIRHHKKHEADHRSFGTMTSDCPWFLKCLYCKHCHRVFASSQHLWAHVSEQHSAFSRLLRICDLPPHVVKYGFWKEEDIDDKCLGVAGSNISWRKKPAQFPDSRILHKKSFPVQGFYDKDFVFPLKCSKCLLLFKTRQRFLRHVCKKVSTNSSESATKKPKNRVQPSELRVRCKFCSLTSTHPQNLRRHLRAMHLHDVSYRCFKCSDELRTIADCIGHHLHYHGLKISRVTAHNLLLNDIVTVSEGHGKFMCAWCGYRGFSLPFVLNHFNSRHILSKDRMKRVKKDGPFFCRWCEYFTRNATSMRAHVSTKHGRTVSYHSLKTFQNEESNSSSSSDKSDEEYNPSAKDRKRQQQLSPSRKKATFDLVEDCAFSSDSDFSGDEVYRSTHERCKHHIRYPHICKFCMNSYVCFTKFLKHSIRDHPLWCSISSGFQRNFLVLPDQIAIPALQKKFWKFRDMESPKSVFYDNDWPCELCKTLFETAMELQEHVQDTHNGKKLFICVYCEFLSYNSKKVMMHALSHSQRGRRGPDAMNLDAVKQKNAKENHDVSEFSNEKFPSTSNIRIVSDSADLSPLALLHLEEHPESPHKRARKSIRRNFDPDQSMSTGKGSFLPGGNKIDIAVDELETGGNIIQEEAVILDNNNVNLHFNYSTYHSGLIRCDRCDFCCTDPDRMSAHVKSFHLVPKQYACKFCDFISNDFINLDDHFAEFHKIKKNHQLGLQLKFSANSSLVKTEAARQSIHDMKSRFLYTPTPCLPIARAEVRYLPSSPVVPVAHRGEDVYSRATTVMSCDAAEIPSCSVDRFKCSYCGHVALSTDRLEIHMRRHEGNFQQDFDQVDSMGYHMNKMGVTDRFS